MAYDLYSGNFDDDQALVAYLMLLFGSARMQRVNFETQWEESASICWPEYRNSFTWGHQRSPGMKYTQYQIDSTGAIDSHRFMAIAKALITPFNSPWSFIQAKDPYLQKQPAARQYFDTCSRVLSAERYVAEANFDGQNDQNLQGLGVFGNHYMITDELDTRPGRLAKGLRYMSCGPGEIYVLQNHQGRVDGYIRYFKWTARQAYQRWPDSIPEVLKAALEKADNFTMFNFLEFVIPRTDYDPHKIFSGQGKPWCSIYVSQTGYCILEKNGYRDFPLAPGRYSQAPEEWYGRGPAQQVLPELKTLNSGKEAYLKQAVMAGDPMYLLPEDGLFDFKAASGEYVYGGMNEEGKPLVGTPPLGNIAMTEKMLEMCGRTVHEAFLTYLYPQLFPNDRAAQKTTREIIENEINRGIFLSPLARQYTEYCAPLINREIGLLAYLKKFPPAPGVVREAGAEYEVKFTSALAQALDMPAIGGFMKTLDMATEVANATGDRSVFYHFGFKRAIPAIAVQQRVPQEWMATAKELAQQEKSAADALKEENRVKSLPGEAAIEKAHAITAKVQTGGNIGGTLSGTPTGGMPLMPGQQTQ